MPTTQESRRKANPAVFPLIEGYEARRMVVYADIAGKPTGGVGHMDMNLRVGDKLTAQQVDAWFALDVNEAIETIYRYIPTTVIDQIPDLSWDALISFVFNLGRQAFVNADGSATNFAKTLTSLKFDQVGTRMKDWDKARVNGVLRPVVGLTVRRGGEAARWERGFQAEAGIKGATIPATTIESVKPEETGVVPEPPAKGAVISPTTAIGTVAAAAGGVAQFLSADMLMSAGKQLRDLGGDVHMLSVIGAVVLAAGIGLMVYRDFIRQRKTGA